MDTGTGRFRHWAQCAVAVIVQRKKEVQKTAKSPPFNKNSLKILLRASQFLYVDICEKQSVDFKP